MYLGPVIEAHYSDVTNIEVGSMAADGSNVRLTFHAGQIRHRFQVPMKDIDTLIDGLIRISEAALVQKSEGHKGQHENLPARLELRDYISSVWNR